ncbi:MAG TPA: hypothetical protein DCL21_00880 [Alphaproteobacteria bacterium]|nr:hypothetical protein [Alphaproteobacteria bacterium]
MNNVFKILIGIILALFALAFLAFAVLNNADILVVLLPEYEVYIPLYVLVLGCFFAGFLSAVIITRFEYLKNKLNIFKLVAKFKGNKNKSKYISE